MSFCNPLLHQRCEVGGSCEAGLDAGHAEASPSKQQVPESEKDRSMV
jgi:hypothetical protein